VRAWEQLATKAATMPTQDAAWTIACLATHPAESRICHQIGVSGLEAIAPIVRHGPTLELAGGREIGEPGDFLAASPEALALLAEQLAQTGSPLMLERIPAGSPTIDALREAYGSSARIELTERASNPVLELNEKWAEPGGGLSSSRRSALRRSRRKAEKYGEVEVELLSPTPDQVDPLLDEAFMIESRSWKGAEGTAVAFHAKLDAFYRRYATELASRQALRLDFLRIGGRAVAMQLGINWKNRHWLLKIGYDAAYSAGSPGQLLLAESVAAASREGLEAYEFFGSRDSWTDAWTEEVQPGVRVAVIPRSARGQVAAAVIRGRIAEERIGGIVRRRKRMLSALAKGRYVAGPELADALPEVERYIAAGYETTVGFSNGIKEPPDEILAENFSIAEALPAGSEVALKLVAAGGDQPGVDELLGTCTKRGLTLHIDAVGPEYAALTQETAKRLDGLAPGKVGCTLPGRWRRSVADAEGLADSGMRVRIVKGELEDREPDEPELVAGCLAVAAALAGGSCHVEVATQDATLAEAALQSLQAADTSCELQVLHAMHSAPAVRVARKLGVPVRVYVPYGTGRLPYTRQQLQRQPALIPIFARDVLLPSPRRPPGA
jgi:CelD/BcsL family acetyltransferase involved in cellulose biosynthesis